MAGHYGPISKAWRASIYLVSHVAIAFVLIGGIELIQLFLQRIGDPKLFDLFPIRFVFDAMDLCILGVFGYFGVMQAVMAFKGE